MTAPGPTRSRWAPDGWLLATSLAAGVGAARLTQAPGAARVVGPVVATVVVGHLATSGARRLRAPVPAAAGAGVVAVALATVWGQCFSATRSGIPTVTTWHALAARFQEAGSVIRSNPTPVPATTGVVLCIAVGAGLVAVMARSLWAGIEARGPGGPLAPLATLLPSFGLFCYTALLSSQVDRVAGAATYLVAALGFVLAADRPPVRPGLAAGAPHSGPPPRLVGSAVLGALTPALTAVVAVAVPLSLSPALTSLKVDALPFAHPGATGGGGGVSLGGGTGPGGGGRNATGPGSLGGNGNGTGAGPPAIGVRTIDLVDDLQAVLTDRTGELMFSATSPVPTYWQVALLTRFNGTAWLPDPTTLAAVQAIPVSTAVRQVPGLPVLPEPAGTGTFRTTVAIADLESTLLPLPPTTESVGAGATLVPAFGAVQQVETPPGEHYSAVARVPVTPSATARGGDAPGRADLAPYLELPSLGARVVRLAHQIVAGAATPAAKAGALARWFNGGRFRYTLTPPRVRGGDALTFFLFSSHAGFCQQFAAAYAVLARIDGLPARVAVGFTTGTAVGTDQYRVSGADAHVWPEVYLGPSVGWTSYEPTPATSGEASGIGVNSGARAGSTGTSRATGTTASTVVPSHHPTVTRPPVPTTTPLVLRGQHGATTGGAGRAGGELGTAAAVGGAVLVTALVALALWRRRGDRSGPLRSGPFRSGPFRRRRRAQADPTEEVLAQWHEAQWTLERLHLGRRPEETLLEHAGRLQRLADADWLTRAVVAGAGGADPVDAYGRLADLAGRALYDAAPCTAEDALHAADLGDTVRTGMARHAAPARPPVGV